MDTLALAEPSASLSVWALFWQAGWIVKLVMIGLLAASIWTWAIIVDKIIAENPEQAEQVKEKPKAMGWFVGQVMKASGGKANPQAVNEILRKKLGL